MVTVTAYIHVITMLSSFVYLLACSWSFVLLGERSITKVSEDINHWSGVQEATDKSGGGGGTDPALSEGGQWVWEYSYWLWRETTTAGKGRWVQNMTVFMWMNEYGCYCWPCINQLLSVYELTQLTVKLNYTDQDFLMGLSWNTSHFISRGGSRIFSMVGL